MTVTIERESDIPLPFSEQEVAETVISETLDYEDCPYEVQVNIILTSNDGDSNQSEGYNPHNKNSLDLF